MPKIKNISIPFARAFFMLLAGLSLFFAAPAEPAYAAAGQKAAWIRAKVEYEYEQGIEGLDDSILVFANDKWTKDDDDWYYYSDRVYSGDRVRFIKAVKFPTSWDNEIINKKFRVIVTVQACEAVRGEEGYAKNHPASYSQTYELWSMGYSGQEALDVSKTGRMTVKINEYQLDEDGDEIPYKNQKIVVPGEKVSKIVEFELNMMSTAEMLLAGILDPGLVRANPVQTGDVPYIFAIVLALSTAGIIIFLVKKKR